MRSILRSLLMLAYLSGAASAQSAVSVAREAEDVKATLVQMWSAIESADVSRYASFVHPDFAQFGETDSYLSEGKAREVRAMEDYVARAKGVHTEMHHPKVTVRGNTAWITYYWTDDGVVDGKRTSSRGKSTRIFVKEDGKWLCIHGHYTLAP